MNVIVIGDVHGCFYTFKKIIEKHWKMEDEILIQVGDLIDRGNHSPQTVKFSRELKDAFPDRVFFLKGNHEYEIIQHFLYRS